MRVAIDAHPLGTRAGGNESFVRHLLFGLKEARPDADILAFVNRNADLSPEAAGGFPLVRLGANSSWIRVPLALPAAVNAVRADLLHVQNIAPPRCPCRYVVTLHDLAWLQHPDTLPWGDRARLTHLVPRTLRQATRVFCETEAVKAQITAFYGLAADRVDVVPNALGPEFTPCPSAERVEAVRRRYDIPPSYVLYVGCIQPRKNLVRLARAFARATVDDPGLHLVLAGKPGWNCGEVLREVDTAVPGRRPRVTGYVEQDDLPVLMGAARVFAYVSIYEGFGLPVIEAMACGVPVLASTDPAIAEVAGPAALLRDPQDVDALADGLRTLLRDDAARESYRREGLRRAACFTRAAMGRAAWAGYLRAVNG